MSPVAPVRKPTPRQLHYLRALALQTATSFTPPATRTQASREIERLRGLKGRGTPILDGARPQGDEVAYATALQPDEVSGFGGTTSWRTHAPASPAAPRATRLGERTVLGRYSVSSGERVLYGQRIDGCVRITDHPASGVGRSYLVERELEQDGYSALKALVADYLEQARELDEIPMASSALRREQRHSAGDA